MAEPKGSSGLTDPSLVSKGSTMLSKQNRGQQEAVSSAS